MTTLERPAPTFEDVWRLFQVTDQKFHETDRLLKARYEETDRKFQETSQLLKEEVVIEIERLQRLRVPRQRPPRLPPRRRLLPARQQRRQPARLRRMPRRSPARHRRRPRRLLRYPSRWARRVTCAW